MIFCLDWGVQIYENQNMLLIILCVLYGNTTWVCIITNQYILLQELNSYEIIANMLCSSSSDYFQLQLITSSLPACKLFHLCPDVEHLRNLEPYKVTVFTRIMKSHKQSDGLL